jgi:hypothetical protein
MGIPDMSVSSRRDKKPVSMRDRVIEIVEDIRLPITFQVIVALGMIRFGCRIPASKLPSLLEREEATFDLGVESRPVWICPAVYSLGCLPVKNLVTLSIWPMSERTIASRTLRVMNLKTLKYLIGLTASVSPDIGAESQARLFALIRIFAGGILGGTTGLCVSDLEQVGAEVAREFESLPDCLRKGVANRGETDCLSSGQGEEACKIVNPLTLHSRGLSDSE